MTHLWATMGKTRENFQETSKVKLSRKFGGSIKTVNTQTSFIIMRESKSMKPVYVDIVYLYLYKYTIVYHSIHATNYTETPNI